MLKAVYIEWEDSGGHSDWTERRDIDTEMLVKSVGWYIDETDDAVIISTSLDPPDTWMSPLVIPKSAIRKRVSVKVPK